MVLAAWRGEALALHRHLLLREEDEEPASAALGQTQHDSLAVPRRLSAVSSTRAGLEGRSSTRQWQGGCRLGTRKLQWLFYGTAEGLGATIDGLLQAFAYSELSGSSAQGRQFNCFVCLNKFAANQRLRRSAAARSTILGERGEEMWIRWRLKNGNDMWASVVNESTN